MQGTAGSRPRGRMVSLGRVTAPKPVNLPSQKRENNGNDPNIPLVPKTVSSSVWGSQAGQGGVDAPPVEAPPQQAPPPAQPAQGQPLGSAWGGVGVPDRRQASALLAQDEFPTLGAPAAEPLPLPNGGPYAHAPQGYPNGIPSSHPHAERTSWDGPGHGAPYEKSGSPGNFHSGSWGAPTGERWADSAPPARPGQGYGAPPPVSYTGMDGRMDMQGTPYMPSQGAGYLPFNQPPPPPPRTRPPAGPEPSGPRYMAAPPEYPGRQQGQHMGGPAAPAQYEGHGPMQSFGPASMAGGGYMPPHLRNRERGEGMPRPGSEWSIAAQPSESLPDEVPQQATPPKILRRDLPAATHPAHQAGPPPQQQQPQPQPPVQHHRGEGHHRSAHGAMPPHPDQAPMQPPPLQAQHPQNSHPHQHHHSQQRLQAPPVQGHGAPQPPRLSVPHQQPPPPPQQAPHPHVQQQPQPSVQRLQFGQLGSPPGYSRDGDRQQPLPAGLHLPNGHQTHPQSGPMGRLQHQHSSGGQGFSPKVAQQLGLHRPESAQDGPVSTGTTDGPVSQSNGPIMTFGQPAQRAQHQPAAHSTRPASVPDAPAPKSARAEEVQPAALNVLEAQKAYMRQKVQQRQEAAKQQQQAGQGQRSASEASKRSMPQSVSQQEPAEPAGQHMPGATGPSGPGRGHRGQGPDRGGRSHDAGRGRGQSRRDVQHPRAPEAQALDKAVPQSLSLSPSEQLIMEAKMRSLSLEATKASSATASGPPQPRQQQQQAHAHQQHGSQQQQPQPQVHARAEPGGAPSGAEGGHRRAGSSARDGQPKAVPIMTAPREPSSRRDAPGPSQQQRRPAAMPIAVPVPERRAQAEGKLPAEGQPPREQRDRGARREKRTRERPPPSGEAPPPEGSQAPVESRQAPSVALESGGPPTQEQSMGGPPGVHRRGSRRGGAQRGERFGGHGTPGIEAEGASKAVDAPPGLEAKQQDPATHAAEDQRRAPAEQGEQSGPGAVERRERRERPPHSSRRERGQRERPPRHPAAPAGAAATVESATEGKGSEPAEGERGQPGAREAQRRPGERAPKKPHASAEAVLGQKIHSPPGLGGLSEQARLPETAVGQESSRRGRTEREIYHPPVQEAAGPSQVCPKQEVHSTPEADAEAPLQMTDGKPPGLGRTRARHGRERRDRRRPPSGASDRAGGEHMEQGPSHDGGGQPEGATEGGAQEEDGPRPRHPRGQGSRGSGRGGSGGGRAKGGAEGSPALADGAQEGSSNAQAGEEKDHPDGLPQRSSRSGRGRGPRGGARNRSSQDGAPAEAGEAGVPDGEAGKTLEVARGSVDAKGRRVWAVKDKAAEGSHAPAEQQGTAGAAPSSSA